MTTFDGTGLRETPPQHAMQADETWTTPATPPESTFDALSMLREAIAERDERDEHVVEIEVPGLGWRLVCDIDFPYAKFAEWQVAGLPKNQRNGRRVNPLRIDQTAVALNVLLNTCVELQYRAGEEWCTFTSADGSPLLPASDELLRRFGIPDPRAFLRKVFGRESRLVEASNVVARKAGWLEDDGDDDGDPTI